MKTVITLNDDELFGVILTGLAESGRGEIARGSEVRITTKHGEEEFELKNLVLTIGGAS